MQLSLVAPRKGLHELEKLSGLINNKKTEINKILDTVNPAHVVQLAGLKLPTPQITPAPTPPTNDIASINITPLIGNNILGLHTVSAESLIDAFLFSSLSDPTKGRKSISSPGANQQPASATTPASKRMKRDNSPGTINIPKPSIEPKSLNEVAAAGKPQQPPPHHQTPAVKPSPTSSASGTKKSPVSIKSEPGSQPPAAAHGTTPNIASPMRNMQATKPQQIDLPPQQLSDNLTLQQQQMQQQMQQQQRPPQAQQQQQPPQMQAQQQQQQQQQPQQQQQRPPQNLQAPQLGQMTQRMQQAGLNQQQIQQQLMQQTGMTIQQLQQLRLQQQRNALMAQGNLTPQQQQQLLLLQRAQQKANEQIARNESTVPISNMSPMNTMAFSNQQLGSMASSNSPTVSMANAGLPRKF